MTSSPLCLSRVESLADIINSELPSISSDFVEHPATPEFVLDKPQVPEPAADPTPSQEPQPDTNDELANLSRMDTADALAFLSTKLSHALTTINQQQTRISALSDQLDAQATQQNRANELEQQVSSLKFHIATKDTMIEKLQNECGEKEKKSRTEEGEGLDKTPSTATTDILLPTKRSIESEPDKEYNPDEVETLVNEVQTFMEQTGMKQHAIAKRMGCSQGTLSSWLKLKYAGDVNRITYRAQMALKTLKSLPMDKIREAGSRGAPGQSEGVVVRRKNFSREQVEILEQVARNTPNPSSEVVEKLSHAFMREPRHIVKWFSNWRSRKLPRASMQMAAGQQGLVAAAAAASQNPLLAHLPLNMHRYAHVLGGGQGVVPVNQGLPGHVLTSPAGLPGFPTTNTTAQATPNHLNEVLQLGSLRGGQAAAATTDPVLFGLMGGGMGGAGGAVGVRGMQVPTLNMQIQQLHQHQQHLQQMQQQQQQQQTLVQQSLSQQGSGPQTPLGGLSQGLCVGGQTPASALSPSGVGLSQQQQQQQQHAVEQFGGGFVVGEHDGFSQRLAGFDTFEAGNGLV